MEAAFIEAVNFRLYVCMCFGFFVQMFFLGDCRDYLANCEYIY